MKKYTASIQGEEYEVEPFNDKYLRPFYSLVVDQRDPLSDSYAINTLKKIVVPTLPDEIAAESGIHKDFYQWTPFIPFEEIFHFVMGIMRCQRLYTIDFIESKKTLNAGDRKRLSTLKDSLEAIDKAIEKGEIAEEEDIFVDAEAVEDGDTLDVDVTEDENPRPLRRIASSK